MYSCKIAFAGVLHKLFGLVLDFCRCGAKHGVRHFIHPLCELLFLKFRLWSICCLARLALAIDNAKGMCYEKIGSSQPTVTFGLINTDRCGYQQWPVTFLSLIL